LLALSLIDARYFSPSLAVVSSRAGGPIAGAASLPPDLLLAGENSLPPDLDLDLGFSSLSSGIDNSNLATSLEFNLPNLQPQDIFGGCTHPAS